MKKIILVIFIISSSIYFNSCSDNEDDNEELSEWECGTHNGNTLYTGPQGGCYYYNSNGNKTYVDRFECDC